MGSIVELSHGDARRVALWRQGFLSPSLTPAATGRLSPAGQEQAIRVQWIGDPAPAQELAYRLIAEQLPIDLGEAQEEGGQMKLLVRYIASLYVVPDGAKPDVSLVSAGPAADGSGLELVFQNAGSAHALLSDLVLTISGGGNEVVLTKDQLETVAGQNVLAGRTRHFVMPWPAGITPGPVEASFTYGG